MRRVGVVALVVLVAGCASATQGPEPDPTSAAIDTTSVEKGHRLAAEIDQDLRAELLERMAEDQAVRTGIAPPGDNRSSEELFAAMSEVDAENSIRMREILDEFGWPGWSLVGRDGAEAAWVLVQHADLDLDLQKRGLELLEAAVAEGDASPGDLAYLTDRILVAEGKPQIYGTQIAIDENGVIAPRTPIEDEENVDARRKAMGLGTLDEYYAELAELDEP